MTEIVTVTEKALEEVKRLLKDESGDNVGLRLAVTGGGCSGFSYKMDFDQIKDNDNIIEFGELKVIIDPKSTIYLKGIQLDYKDGLNGKGFVFNNPNAKNTCGCGESFSV